MSHEISSSRIPKRLIIYCDQYWSPAFLKKQAFLHALLATLHCPQNPYPRQLKFSKRIDFNVLKKPERIIKSLKNVRDCRASLPDCKNSFPPFITDLSVRSDIGSDDYFGSPRRIAACCRLSSIKANLLFLRDPPNNRSTAFMKKLSSCFKTWTLPKSIELIANYTLFLFDRSVRTFPAATKLILYGEPTRNQQQVLLKNEPIVLTFPNVTHLKLCGWSPDAMNELLIGLKVPMETLDLRFWNHLPRYSFENFHLPALCQQKLLSLNIHLVSLQDSFCRGLCHSLTEMFNLASFKFEVQEPFSTHRIHHIQTTLSLLLKKDSLHSLSLRLGMTNVTTLFELSVQSTIPTTLKSVEIEGLLTQPSTSFEKFLHLISPCIEKIKLVLSFDGHLDLQALKQSKSLTSLTLHLTFDGETGSSDPSGNIAMNLTFFKSLSSLKHLSLKLKIRFKKNLLKQYKTICYILSEFLHLRTLNFGLWLEVLDPTDLYDFFSGSNSLVGFLKKKLPYTKVTVARKGELSQSIDSPSP